MEKEKRGLQARGAGVLMPVSALPSNYGIGTFGEAAYHFVDCLAEAKQKYWQVLPVGPTSYGDSPYQSFSAFAGNPYFIDLDVLVEEGLLSKEQIGEYNWGENEETVDYALLYEHRFQILREAYKKSTHKRKAAYKKYCQENIFWLDDYSLYMSVKNVFKNHEWLLWDEDIRNREPEALNKYQRELSDDVDFWKFLQYKFNEQWTKLKAYANERGIRIIGDIPLYVALDSADVWVHGRLFDLDERKTPIHIAGVPPDYFSATGQRWGNPIYRWEVMEEEDFSWWRQRMKANAALYDVIRIDHFIGVVRYYSIPSTCPTAVEGKWMKGPGKKLTDAITQAIGESEIIAEDLGVIAPSVRRLIQKTGWPGMKILEFAFDSDGGNDNLPHEFDSPNYVVYGGTHDNETVAGFFKGAKKEIVKFAMEYLHVKRKADLTDACLRAAYGSIANTAIFQMQDILELDNTARMNVPGVLGGNWQWRMQKGKFGEKEIHKLAELVRIYGR